MGSPLQGLGAVIVIDFQVTPIWLPYPGSRRFVGH